MLERIGGIGTTNLETRLAPLYDIVSTIYYPELSEEMAMKLGREYSSQCVTPADFDKLAEEAGLAKPFVRQRIVELAQANLAALEKAKKQAAHAEAEGVAKLIRQRSERAANAFRK
jgi:serine/threonine-protein kinase HipA